MRDVLALLKESKQRDRAPLTKDDTSQFYTSSFTANWTTFSLWFFDLSFAWSQSRTYFFGAFHRFVLKRRTKESWLIFSNRAMFPKSKPKNTNKQTSGNPTEFRFLSDQGKTKQHHAKVLKLFFLQRFRLNAHTTSQGCFHRKTSSCVSVVGYKKDSSSVLFQIPLTSHSQLIQLSPIYI